MNTHTLPCGILLAAMSLSACSTLQDLVSAPTVSLSDVQVDTITLTEQTFVLSFDVSNPNPFPLPVNAIDYGVTLDGHRFASGETQCDFSVPAGGDGEFAISVELNLLRSAPELLFLVRDGASREIPYSLEGNLGVNIPYARPVHFESAGQIRLIASGD